MRSTILILLTACLLGFGYFAYWILQEAQPIGQGGGGKSAIAGSEVVSPPSVGPSGMGAGGERPYWERYDAGTGQRTSRLRAERYEPQKDGRVLVTQPEVEFFLRDNRRLRIMGKTGLITMEERIGRPGGALGAGSQGAPRSGSLRDVTLMLFAKAEDVEPELTMTMNNASFDNETFVIRTEAFNDGGKVIGANQVPITVRGRKYEFDGKGLVLRYNEVDRRLESLNVATGRRLLIKEPGELGRASTRPAGIGLRGLPEPVGAIPGLALAAADRSIAGEGVRREARRGMAASRPAEEEPVYRAVFSRDVEILRDGKRLAIAKEMVVDFLSESGGESGILGMGSVGAVGARPVAAVPGSPVGVRRRGGGAEGVSRQAEGGSGQAKGGSRPGSVPATRPGEGPIEILWNGPLTIVPLPGDRPERIASGESIVRLLGSADRPVDVTNSNERGSSRIVCSQLTFWTIDNGFALEGSPSTAVEITDSNGTRIITRSMEYSEAGGAAVLTGKSHASLPLMEEVSAEGKGTRKADLLEVDWADRCTLYLQGGGFDSMAIERADLRGRVKVDHPQLKMSSDGLQLAFGSEGKEGVGVRQTNPPLRQIDASGAVSCVVIGPNGPADVRKIDCDTLKLLTARTESGQLFARSIAAIGSVHAVDSERDLRAGYVHVSLAAPATRPATRPATQGALTKAGQMLPGELEGLVAHEKVEVVTPDGKRVSADQLTLDVKDKEASATLHGEPAVIKADKSTLTGRIIQVIPDRKRINVTGGGVLDGISQKSAEDRPRPVKVTWTKSMRADGGEDVVECFGEVTAESTDPDGAENVVRGDHVRLMTTTRPSTTQPSGGSTRVVERPETRPTTRRSEFDALGDRVIKSIAIQDDAEVRSDLKDGTGRVVRAFRVKSAAIYYDRDEKRLTIPQAGWMGFMDNRMPATRPAAMEAAKDPLGIRGLTVFMWTKGLVYDEKAGRVTLTGDSTLGGAPVTVRREINPGENTEAFALVAERVVADLEPTTEATTRPAGNEYSPRMQFRRVLAEGHVHVTGKEINFEAETIEYDPSRHLVTIRGTERRRAIQRDADGVEVASFDEMVWNTEKGEVVSSKNLKASPSGMPKTGPLK